MKKVMRAVGLVFVVGLIYFLAWPVSVDPQAWDAPKAPKYSGKYAVNTRLANFEALSLDGLTGPEAVIEDETGNIYATTHEGWILRWRLGEKEPERWVRVGGRPLGIAFDSQQNLWVANAYIGLQKISPNAELTVELTESGGIPLRYADDLVVAPNGKIYFSDASTKFSAAQSEGTLSASLLDILEHGGHGRVIEYDPSTGESVTIMRGLTFANGVTASGDGQYLLVAETGSYQLWKYWLHGSKIGQAEVIAKNLPGFPDNIHRGLSGRYWLGFTSPRNHLLDALSGAPFLRKIMQRLPVFLRPSIVPYGHVIAVDGQGEVLHSLQDPAGTYPATTGAWETEHYLYVSSLTAPYLARYKKEALGIID